MTVKTCFKCSRDLPPSEFYQHAKMADGLLGKCKECAKIDVRQNRNARLDHYRRYDSIRSQRPERKLHLRETVKLVKQKYPEKTKARNAAGNAIRDGRIIRPNRCSSCSVECRPEAHHEDYSKPLEVVWLCSGCHGRAHSHDQKKAA